MKAQLPVTSVVTPWCALLSPPGSSSIVVSEWLCMSMKPGATTSPVGVYRALRGRAAERADGRYLPAG